MINLQIFENDEIIIKENEFDSYLYYIESGKVKVFKTLDNKEIILGYLTEGDFFGEMALIDDKPRSASVSAVNTTKLKVFHRNNFLDIIKSDNAITTKFLSGLFNRLRVSNSKIVQYEIDNKQEVNATNYNETSYNLTIEGITEKAINSLPQNPFSINKFPFIIGRKSRDPFSHKNLEIQDEAPLQISRHHLSFEIQDNKLVLFDVGSSLGLGIDGKRIGGIENNNGPIVLENEHLLIIGGKSSEYEYTLKINQ